MQLRKYESLRKIGENVAYAISRRVNESEKVENPGYHGLMQRRSQKKFYGVKVSKGKTISKVRFLYCDHVSDDK